MREQLNKIIGPAEARGMTPKEYRQSVQWSTGGQLEMASFYFETGLGGRKYDQDGVRVASGERTIQLTQQYTPEVFNTIQQRYPRAFSNLHDRFPGLLSNEE